MKTTITPRKAKSILSTNTNNRKINPRHVSRLARQMVNGDWIYNGQSIVLNDKGKLLDGQHRLMACIESNASFVTELIKGVTSTHAFETIDTGKARSSADILGIEGFKNTNHLASIARLIISYSRQDDKREWRLGRICDATNKEVLDCANDLTLRIGANRVSEIIYKSKKIKGSGAAIMFGAFMLDEIDPELTNQFLDKIGNVLFYGLDDPCKRFFEYLTMFRNRPTNAETKTQLLGAFFKAWNSFLNDQPLKRIQVREGAKITLPNRPSSGGALAR